MRCGARKPARTACRPILRARRASWALPPDLPRRRRVASSASPCGLHHESPTNAAVEQAEIVFTLRCDPGEPRADFPHDPLHLLAKLYQLANQGTPIGPGGVTEFGDPIFFGHHLLYVEAQPLDEVPLPPSCLAALLITTDELRAVREFGPTRVLVRMGQASSHYPFPPWADRRRPGLSLTRTFEQSVLSDFPRTGLPDTRVRVENNQIMLTAPRGAQPPWQDRLAALTGDVPLALLTAMDPAADGCLVWLPGQSGPEAITAPGADGSRLGGCFVVVIPNQPENGGRIVEDGVVAELTADAWKVFSHALIEGKEVEIPADGTGTLLAVSWKDQGSVGAVDGRSQTSAGWNVFEPWNRKEAADTVAITEVRLLTPEHEVAAQTSVAELAEFCQVIERCARSAVGDRDDAGELLIRMRCTADGHEVNLAGRGDVGQPVMSALYEAITQLAGLPVQTGEVSFEIELSVSPARRA